MVKIKYVTDLLEEDILKCLPEKQSFYMVSQYSERRGLVKRKRKYRVACHEHIDDNTLQISG